MESQQYAGSPNSDRPERAPDDQADVAEIDLDRAIWDAEYRRKALSLLRRARDASKVPSEISEPSKRDNEQR